MNLQYFTSLIPNLRGKKKFMHSRVNCLCLGTRANNHYTPRIVKVYESEILFIAVIVRDWYYFTERNKMC